MLLSQVRVRFIFTNWNEKFSPIYSSLSLSFLSFAGCVNVRKERKVSNSWVNSFTLHAPSRDFKLKLLLFIDITFSVNFFAFLFRHFPFYYFFIEPLDISLIYTTCVCVLVGGLKARRMKLVLNQKGNWVWLISIHHEKGWTRNFELCFVHDVKICETIY